MVMFFNHTIRPQMEAILFEVFFMHFIFSLKISVLGMVGLINLIFLTIFQNKYKLKKHYVVNYY